MKRQQKKIKKNAAPQRQSARAPGRLWLAGGALLLLAGVIAASVGFRQKAAAASPDEPPSAPAVEAAAKPIVHPPGSLTFNKDVAPIIFQNCSVCHHPGASGPFNLLTYAEVKKRAKAIADVTKRRYMPPWLPEPGVNEFAGERRLTPDELAILQQWIAEGCTEGNAADLPPAPEWKDGWQLGTPDLIVTLPQPYILQADGKDVYHNVVVPIPVSGRRYVKAVEFQPGNYKVVHHAFINMDQTRESRRLAEKNNPPGFDGMQLPESAIMVAGQMLGWQPGKRPEVTGEGLSWPLEKGTDLVLQLHLHPTGKEEKVQPSVGFYFTDEPPTRTPYRLYLPQWRIDIPAGAKDYAVENSYTLPVDVDVLRVSPHAHYLAKEMQGYAILPDGTKKWLLLIKNWDFNWQGDYRYKTPIFLPKGTKVFMHFTYDNSADNPRNPNQPPKRVRYGLQTTDEMAELCYQVVPRSAEDLAALRRDFFKKSTLDAIAYNEWVLQENPNDAEAHAKLGEAMLPLGRFDEGERHLRAAIRLNPNNDKPHYDLGALCLARNQLPEAQTEFESVLRLNPGDYQAHGSLGAIYMRLGNLNGAEDQFAAALRLNPDDPIARRNLEMLEAAKRKAGR